MIDASDISIRDLVRGKNQQKILFTAGPASLVNENLIGLSPCFGRGDHLYAETEGAVMKALCRMTGHESTVSLQGSATTAIEVFFANYVRGRVLLIESGYYSTRMKYILRKIQSWSEEPISITTQKWQNLESDGTTYDWVISCYTETSEGIRLPVDTLRHLADKSGAKLMLDATASVGLEEDHDLADAVVYSSCKGLFGLTGAGFIGMNQLEGHFVPSFILDIDTYLEKKTTGPYHAISSLSLILSQHDFFRESVLINKARFSTRFCDYLDIPNSLQPNLCTRTTHKIQAIDERVILYNSRSTELKGSITCHLGEVHLGRSAKGDIVDHLSIKS